MSIADKLLDFKNVLCGTLSRTPITNVYSDDQSLEFYIANENEELQKILILFNIIY